MLIGFGHKRQRGKDTACDYLVKEWGFIKDHFAFSIKEGLGKYVFGLNEEQLYGAKKTEVDPFWQQTPRSILQRIGTDVMRNHFDQDVWVKTLEKRYLSHKEEGKNVCIADVRFPNEAKMIKGNGGILIRIDRNLIYEPEVDTHESETALDNYIEWDYNIDNNKSFAELYHKLYKVIQPFTSSFIE